MTHQFTNRINFFEPAGIAGFDEPAVQRQTPIFFVGIQRDISPPLVFGHSRLQRMRVIVVEPRDLDPNPFDDEATEPQLLPEVLPQLPPPSALPRHLLRESRLVTGEILRGENDELYEKIGNRIWRLRRLACSPYGEILDVPLDLPESAPRPAPSRARVAAARVCEEEKQAPTVTVEAEPAAETSPAVLRSLLPEPGQWRVVCFGSFKQMLAPQLAHPERLRDVHRLPCYVQVYEATAPQKFEALARAVCGDRASLSDIQPLTHSLVMDLQLAPLLSAPARIPPSAQREAGVVLPGERVFRLQLANDPTAEQPPLKTFEPSAVGQPSSDTHASTLLALKTAIPECFLKPWEFHASREEALYDLSCASTFRGWLGGKLRRLVHCLAFRHELRRWQVLLSGKSVDEQLWSVRPPRGGLTHPFVQSWAKNAIELAGYDARNMLTEWQIFWRRKGA
jgi:hypothetical protein